MRVKFSHPWVLALVFALGACSSTPKNREGLRQRTDKLLREAVPATQPDETRENKPLTPPSRSSASGAPGAESTAIGPPRGEGKIREMGEGSGKKIYSFDKEGVWIMSKAETQLEAERHAEDQALSAALSEAGVEVYYGFSDLSAQLGGEAKEAVARYTSSWTKGLPQYQRVSSSCEDIQGQARPSPEDSAPGAAERLLRQCRVRIRGEIIFNGEPDPRFEILLENKGEQLGLPRSVFRDGEEIDVSALLTQEAYLYILSVAEDQKTFLVFPNRLVLENRVRPGEIFRFPKEGSGLALKAALPPEIDHTAEVLHLIAVKSGPLFDPAELSEESVGPYKALSPGRLGKVTSKLAKLKRNDWTMAVLPYQITR